MSGDALTSEELLSYALNGGAMPPKYVHASPATTPGPAGWRLLDAAHISTGIMDPNRLGSGATGAGNLYLADDGTWKVISGAPGVGDMLKATYDTDNTGVVDNAERIAIVGRNATGSTLYRGTIVYISGSTGNRPNFVKAQANAEATSAGTFGVVISDIANNSDGYAAHIGVLDNLDTRSTATNPFTDVTLVDGDTIYLHPTIAGYITNVKPSAPNHLVYVGKVTRTSPTNGTIVYRIQNGYELDELHDVAISSKANNDLLVYESATNLWKNKTFAAIFGGTPLVTVPTLQQVTTAGNTTTNAILAAQFQINGTTRNARLSSDNVGGFDINYNIGGTPDWRWFGGGTTALTTFKANGNVLIGTTTDAGYRLDVIGSGRYYGAVEDASISGTLTIVTANTNLRLGGNTTYSWIQSHSSKPLYINELGNNVILNLAGGAVGIGTASPSYKLDVQGTTTAHAISTQVGLNFNPVASPTTGSLALVASAGNVNLGLHYYFVTFTTALGETNPYQIGSITTTSGNQQVTVTIPVSTDSRVTGRKLYRTKAGAWYWETFNLATIADNTSTTYTDNIADASLTGTSGTGFYQVNTTHRALTINGVQSLVVDTFATYLGVGAGGGVTSGGGNNTFIGFNAGRWSYTSNQSVGIGNAALSAQTGGANNIGIGSQAGGFTTGGDNIAIGRNAAININTGSSNTIVGSFTWNLGSVTGKDGNTGLGYRVGSNNTGNYNLFLGYDAGYYVTGSNQILLDTVTRADEATAKSSALIYGVTSATVANQILSLGGGGNVGIGTLSPTYRLDVRGTTLAASTISTQGAFNIFRVAAPTGTLTLTPSAGGSVDVGQHYYFVSFTTALGETNVALTTAITIVSGSQTVTITGIPVSTDPRVTGRKIYRTRAGQTSDRGMVIATIADNTTTSYVDTAADSTFPNLGDWGAYRDNTTSSQITIDGTKAMALGSGVTSIGIGAGASITTAGLTTLVGTNAGNAITYGFQNTLVGTLAGRFVSTGSGNTVLGSYSLMAVTTGSDNIAIGRNASFYNVTGSYNIAIGGGVLSGQSGVSHSSNIGIGSAALYNLGAADNNIAIGYQAGRYISSGSNNTLSSNSIFIGYDARPNADSETNQVVIGYNGRGLGSNTTVLGNSSTTFTSIPAGNMTIGGTTNAGYKLDVQGNTRVAGSVEVGANSAVQGGLSLYQKYTTSTNFIGSISTEYASGAMILGYGAVGKAGVAGYVSSFDNFSGYRSAIKIGQATPLLVLGTSSAVATTVGSDITMNTLFQITNAGNVGIGSSNPTQKLDVVGNAKLRGATFFGAINQPSAPTLTTNSTTGGTLAAATYYYRIVAVDFFNNTTTPSNELAVTTTGSTSSITISWPLVQGAYNYRIYRGTTSGGQDTYYLVNGTNTTSFTDTGAAGTAGTTPTENLTSYGYYNTNGDFRSGNILIVNNGVGNTSSIIFDKSTDGPQINVTEYANDSTLFEFSLRDNPDGPDAFHFVMPDWQNPSSGWKPFKFAAFTTQVVGKDTNFWSSFSMPSSTPYYTTNPESVANSQIKWDPYTSTSYNLLRDSGTGTGNLNVDVTGYTGSTHNIYWVKITSATTFNWGTGWSGGTPVATGVTITGGWQVLGSGVSVRLTGTFVANDTWAFRVFPVPRMGIGTTTPIAPLQVSTTIAASSGTGRGVYFNPTVVATANNDTLVGLDIAPTFTTGAFTGVTSWGLRVGGSVFLKDDNSSIDFINQNGRLYSAGGVFTISNGAGADGADVLRFGHTNSTGTRATVIAGQVIKFQRGGFSTTVGQIFGSTGNWVIQNGGTFTDAGYKLDVQGTIRSTGVITASGGTSTDWNTAYGWGNHASAGYITSYTETDTLNSVTGRGATTTNAITVGGLTVATNLIYTDTVNSRVGIGTTTPSQTLEVVGNVLVTTSSATQPLKTFEATYKQFSVDYPSSPSIYTTQINFANFGRLQYDGNGGVLSIENRSTQAGSSSMRFIMGTTERMRITDTGNVLINTTTDAGYKLDVNGTLRSTGNAYFDSSVGIGTTQPVGLLNLFGGTGNNPAILTLQSQSGGGGNTGIYFRPYQNVTFANTAPAQATILAIDASYSAHLTFSTKVPGSGTNSLVERMRLTSTGELGIGTTTPSTTLHVGGGVRFGTGGAGTGLHWDNTNNRLGIGSSTPSYTLEVMGVAYFNEAIRIANGEGIKFWVDKVRIQPTGIDSLGFYVGGAAGSPTERMRIANDGNVLIGTTTNSGYKLDVSGTINSTGYNINGVVGWTGIITIPTNPPGMQNIDIQSGIVVNVF